MKILAIETSTSQCSAALLISDGILERSRKAVHAHAELILPMLEALLAEGGVSLAQLDALAFGRGPGGFTGVRVAAAVVQGLAFGIERPVVPVSDLMALAAGVHRRYDCGKILSCIDARMNQVYWCAYETNASDDFKACLPEALGAPESVQPPTQEGWFGAGSGFDVYKGIFTGCIGQALAGEDGQLVPAAQDVAMLARNLLIRGQTVSPDEVLPVYLRDRVAWPKSGL